MEEKIKVCPYCGADRISYSFTRSNYFCLECRRTFVELDSLKSDQLRSLSIEQGRTFVEPDIDNTKKDKMTKEREIEAQIFERAHLIRIEYFNEKQKEEILKSLPRWVKIKIYKYDG